MTFALYIVLTLLCLSPVFFCLRPLRNGGQTVSVAAAARAFYVSQYDALALDAATHRIDEVQLQYARTEIARRMLSTENITEQTQRCASWRWVVAILISTASLGMGLYLANGAPTFRPQPASLLQAPVDPHILSLITQLEHRVTRLKAGDPGFVKGNMLLAAVRERQGDLPSAIRAYRAALSVAFEPQLAVHIADLQSQSAHRVTADSLALYRKALAAAPADAYWRIEVAKRIAIGEQDNGQVAP